MHAEQIDDLVFYWYAMGLEVLMLRGGTRGIILEASEGGGAMHLKKTKRKGRVYLSVVQNYRENGRTRTKTIESIGYVDALEKTYPDPIAHFQAYVDKLNKQRLRSNPPVELRFAADSKINPDHVASTRWGCAIALAYLDALGVRDFFDARAGHAGFPPHAGRIFELLASERIIHVASKRESWERRASFPRACDFSLTEVYQALPCFASHDESLIRAMNAAYHRIRGSRRRAQTYVVLSPAAFAETGDVASAHRAATSQVGGMAMILDEDTIPVSYRFVSSRPTPDEFAELAREARRDTGAAHAVVIASRAANIEQTMAVLDAQGDGFIFYRPLKSAVPELQSWVDDPQGYIATQSGSYKVKSRLTRVDAHGVTVPVKELVLWGRDFAQRTRLRRSNAIEQHSTMPETGQEDASLASVDQLSTAETHIIDSHSDEPAAPGKANASRNAGDAQHSHHAASSADLDGYLYLVTSETKQPEAVIFHLYREIWRLAEPFQVLESDFSPSPYPVSHDQHIQAHFLICYAAFFALRLLRADMGWRYNAAQVADALLRMEGAYLDENWFLFSYRSEITDAIEEAAGVDAARRLRTPPEIRRDIARARTHIEHAE